MFPNLHASNRGILVSPEQFSQQLAYMTSTFGFYIHREHHKLLKLSNNPTHKINNFAQNSNISYVRAVATRCDYDISEVCDTTDWVSEPLQDQPVCAVTARLYGSTLAIPCAQHLSPTKDSLTLL